MNLFQQRSIKVAQKYDLEKLVLYFARQSKHQKIHQEQYKARLMTIKGRNKDMKLLLMLMLIKQLLLINS